MISASTILPNRFGQRERHRGGMDAQACRYGGCRDAGRHNPRQSGVFYPAPVAIWILATRSRWAVALGRRLGSRRHLGTPRPELGLPLPPAAVAIRAVGQTSGQPLGMEWRLGSRRQLGTPRSGLGLPLAVAEFMPPALNWWLATPLSHTQTA